ncbi:MAG: polysaccharide deacetylase family protein [Dehalococcoidia bacterium]|nr:polysaccharide deacetylase family protein [Dehalococcoidia bacterium]
MSDTVPILLYHSVAPYATPRFRRWVMPPDRFAEQMAYLRANGYTPLTVTALARAMTQPAAALPHRPVVVTFDDAIADFYIYAMPVLQDLGIVATLYVPTAFVGGTSRWLEGLGEGQRPMLTWTQLRELRMRGIECGSHGHTHRQLDALPRMDALNEIVLSTALLQEQLGDPVLTFAYPFGYYDQSVRHMVEEAGYLSACGVKHALSALHDDRFALARIVIESDTDLSQFASLLAGEGLPVAPNGARIQTRGWRILRRSRASVGRVMRLAFPKASGGTDRG